MKKWIAVMLVALMALSLIACGGKSDGVVGTWKLDSGTNDEADQYVQLVKAFGMEMEITFKEDGTGSVETSMAGETQSSPFNYTYENGNLKIEGADDTGKMYLDGNKLILESEGMGLVFKKK